MCGCYTKGFEPGGEGTEEPYLLFIFARTASLLIRVVSAVVVEVASIAQWHTAAIGAVEVLGVTGVHGWGRQTRLLVSDNDLHNTVPHSYYLPVTVWDLDTHKIETFEIIVFLEKQTEIVGLHDLSHSLGFCSSQSKWSSFTSWAYSQQPVLTYHTCWDPRPSHRRSRCQGHTPSAGEDNVRWRRWTRRWRTCCSPAHTSCRHCPPPSRCPRDMRTPPGSWGPGDSSGCSPRCGWHTCCWCLATHDHKHKHYMSSSTAVSRRNQIQFSTPWINHWNLFVISHTHTHRPPRCKQFISPTYISAC